MFVLDERHMRPKRHARWAGVNDVLRTVLRRVASPAELAGYSVWTFWDEVVGERIANGAQPAHFRDGVLIVNVANHSLIQDLEFMKLTLRDKLNERLPTPAIRDFAFVPGSVERLRPAPQRTATPQAGVAEIEVPDIEDGNVRDAFTQLLAARARRIAGNSKP